MKAIELPRRGTQAFKYGVLLEDAAGFGLLPAGCTVDRISSPLFPMGQYNNLTSAANSRVPTAMAIGSSFSLYVSSWCLGSGTPALRLLWSRNTF
jgi:hypothetical protein